MSNKDRSYSNRNFSISLANCQSIKNKSDLIADIVSSKRPSMMFLTETWMQSEDNDWHMKNASPTGYSQINRIRPSGARGGGVGVIFQNGINCLDKSTDFKSYSSFEHLAIQSTRNGLLVSYYLIYRPPPSASNNLTKAQFLPEFSDFLETIAIRPGHLCVLGDFNIPWDKHDDPERKNFASLLSAFGLHQHVQDPTHSRGHTIDYIITKSDNDIVSKVDVGELVSDHCIINAFLNFSKPEFPIREVSYRRIKNIDLNRVTI